MSGPLQNVFFFQAEDGIRALIVTGVQTCALPISSRSVGGNGWASQVPGGPSRACPALRPRRERHAKPLRRVDVAFRNFGTRRLPPLSISGLNHTACALAVYASQPGSPLDHARL